MPKLKIADLVIDIKRDNPILAGQIADYLSKEPADITVDFGQDYIEREIEAEVRSNFTFSPAYSEYLAIYRYIATAFVDHDGFLMHGSALAFDGKGYLFTAPSGTGKSTHTRLWREVFGDRVVMVNDDKPMVTRRAGRFYLSGTPWNGKHDLDSNITVPLGGIVFLERGKENKIDPASPDRVLPLLFRQVYRPADSAHWLATIDLLNDLLAVCPLYRLVCNMDKEAARVAMAGLVGANGETPAE